MSTTFRKIGGLFYFTERKQANDSISLEDSYERIQSRLLDITEDAPDNLFFSVMCERLAGGLVEQIEVFLTEHPATSLIVIDTLQNIRNDSGADLFCTGRDIESAELRLELDNDTHIWKLTGGNKEEKIRLVDDMVLALRDCEFTVSNPHKCWAHRAARLPPCAIFRRGMGELA